MPKSGQKWPKVSKSVHTCPKVSKTVQRCPKRLKNKLTYYMNGPLATIRKETSESPEHKKKYQFLPEEPMISERPNTNQVGIRSAATVFSIMTGALDNSPAINGVL
jgi:hypothetical protein